MNHDDAVDVIMKALRDSPKGWLDQSPKDYGLSEDEFSSAVNTIYGLDWAEVGEPAYFHTREATAVLVRQRLTLTKKGRGGEV